MAVKGGKGGGKPAREGRERRLAEALRANLARRKGQRRGRAEAADEPGGEATEKPRPKDG
ncbi:MAG: hypothetical protein QF578_06375 [Alphaproteobacteria bacterium]|nr:hypothetical protein [Alphaproteobacteria bacterium]MDP6813429.1 hypothetical protein [Alphaproteobacteria bacterium]